MWRANKRGLCALGLGLLVLGGIHYLLSPSHEQLADQVLALGFCLLLFVVGLLSWLSVKTPEADERDDEEPPPQDE